MRLGDTSSASVSHIFIIKKDTFGWKVSLRIARKDAYLNDKHLPCFLRLISRFSHQCCNEPQCHRGGDAAGGGHFVDGDFRVQAALQQDLEKKEDSYALQIQVLKAELDQLNEELGVCAA